MAVARRHTVTRLNEACRQGIGPFPAARLTVVGVVEDSLDGLDAAAAITRLRDNLADARRRDAESGGATLGPHRSDLQVRHGDKDLPAEHCSTGEQKALIIAIMLAYVRRQPLLARYRVLSELLHADWQVLKELFHVGWPISVLSMRKDSSRLCTRRATPALVMGEVRSGTRVNCAGSAE